MVKSVLSGVLSPPFTYSLATLASAEFPLPFHSKIICPGLGRTGTTTLSACLKALGFRTLQSYGHWYLVENHESTGRLRLNKNSVSKAERFDAFVDSPIPLIYQELCRVWPGSMVIVTRRNREDYLASIARLHEAQRRQLMTGSVERRNFEAFNRQVLGGAWFDRAAYAAAFDRFYSEVDVFFRNRSEAVLQLDLVEDPTWDKLCRFLDRPVPNRPFPHHNQSKIS